MCDKDNLLLLIIKLRGYSVGLMIEGYKFKSQVQQAANGPLRKCLNSKFLICIN